MLILDVPSITDIEREILTLRYYHNMTLKDIAIYLGRKKSYAERVRQIEAKALKKLRRGLC